MRMKIYNALVNRYSGISNRYHKVHDNKTLFGKIISYLYLLWLNFCLYVLQCRFLRFPKNDGYLESKNLILNTSESALRLKENMSVDEVISNLSKYDIISFDIFDTLIFRPFDEPTALFYIMGEKLGYMDFKRLRIEAENDARWDKFRKEESFEVNIYDIWDKLEDKTGLSAVDGVKLELMLEQRFCYANPFMKKVFDALISAGKNVIITSDMYLPQEFLENMLETKGFVGAKHVFISNELNLCKGNGELFKHIREKLHIGRNEMIHIGDNVRSDIQMAKKAGVVPCYYPNVHKKIQSMRAYDMHPITGAAYRGLVDNHLYCGQKAYSMEYEYGYVYGGFFVVGYCHFIHEYCKQNDVDKLLFLSRDGDILKQVYDMLYPDDNTEYVYWSRKAATKLMASSDRYDFIRRFLLHKVNQKKTLIDIFESMELTHMLARLAKELGYGLNDELTDGNVKDVCAFLTGHWDEVCSFYEAEHSAAKKYYLNVLQGCRKAVAVDIGWAGSGALALNHLVSEIWKIPCEITGLIAGTNTIHNFEPFASETFLLNGTLVSYMYSMSHNRDIMKLHDPNKNFNVYWELLLSSPTPQFVGFCPGNFPRMGSKDVYLPASDITLRFGNCDSNLDGIYEIQSGILDFAKQYREHFGCPKLGEFAYMYNISGRDAYAPMIVAASRHERYLKKLYQAFDIDINV